MLVSPYMNYIQQGFPLCQVQSKVESNTLFYSVLVLLFLSFCCIVADFELLTLETLWTMYMDQTAGIHKNNLDHKEG